MKIASEVTPDKLRGGFYTPDELVDLCLARIAELEGPKKHVLEPSVGDGSFVRGMSRAPFRSTVDRMTGIEPMDIEAEKARRALSSAGFGGEILTTSAISWAAATTDTYDVAVGNPPFVRYQFISRTDRAAADTLAELLGVQMGGVSNLWIPVLLGALSRLRAGGAFAFVVPTEIMTGVSAGLVRRWLIANCESVRFDLFPPQSFPAVLQEVTVLSGSRRREPSAHRATRLRLVEHFGTRESLDWSHEVTDDGPWTKYLLAPIQVEALETAARDPRAARLGDLVAFEVSIVTGANDFFTVTDDTVDAFGLEPWVRPLLPRIRHAPGLRYMPSDHVATAAAGARAWLLDFSDSNPDPQTESGPASYLAQGVDRSLPGRYKCRIRDPWYRVPGIKAGELLLSKRSHYHPRVAVNEAAVFTTDTIYRGRLLQADLSPETVATNFHCSLTLLSAELEGRSFGGGVLELVPSETARLLTYAQPPASNEQFRRLDEIARTGDMDAVVRETDSDLIRRRLLEEDVAAALDEARRCLMTRRLERNRRQGAQPERVEGRSAA